MYEWFQKQTVGMKVVLVVIALIVAWTLLQFVLGLIRALIPIAILAVIIVGALWLVENLRD